MRALLAAAFLLLLALPPVSAQAAQGHRIPIAQYAYQPGDMTVRVGEAVTWTNQDQAPHDVVTSAGPAVLQSPMLAQGQSWSFTFTVAGTYDYYCSVHPDMRARITVLPEETPDQATPAPVPVGQRPAEQPVGQPAVPAHEAAPAPTTSAPTTSAPTQVVAATPPSSTGLDPMLLLAGLVAAVTTFCLLLIGSRPEKRREP
jgi:amicyanin